MKVINLLALARLFHIELRNIVGAVISFKEAFFFGSNITMANDLTMWGTIAEGAANFGKYLTTSEIVL